jgi:hypothetical protein
VVNTKPESCHSLTAGSWDVQRPPAAAHPGSRQVAVIPAQRPGLLSITLERFG